MRLSLHHPDGGLDVDAMLERIEYRQLIEWQAYDTMFPIGPDLLYRHIAVMPYVFSAAFAGKGSKPKFDDFLLTPRDKDESHGQSAQQMADALLGWAAALNALPPGVQFKGAG